MKISSTFYETPNAYVLCLNSVFLLLLLLLYLLIQVAWDCLVFHFLRAIYRPSSLHGVSMFVS